MDLYKYPGNLCHPDYKLFLTFPLWINVTISNLGMIKSFRFRYYIFFLLTKCIPSNIDLSYSCFFLVFNAYSYIAFLKYNFESYLIIGHLFSQHYLAHYFKVKLKSCEKPLGQGLVMIQDLLKFFFYKS